MANTILHRGRLSIPEIASLTKLRGQAVTGIILTLIQHNLCWYSFQPQGDREIEYFEMNVKEILMRLRWGRILEIVERKNGKDARDIVRVVLMNGKLKLGGILEEMGPEALQEPRKCTFLSFRHKHKQNKKLVSSTLV